MDCVHVDRRHKLVRRYQVTDAAVHDSQVVDDILDPDNTASEVWADSAYRSAEIEAKLKEKGLKRNRGGKGFRAAGTTDIISHGVVLPFGFAAPGA